MPKKNHFSLCLFKKSSHNLPTIRAKEIKEGNIYVGSLVLDTEKNIKIIKNHKRINNDALLSLLLNICQKPKGRNALHGKKPPKTIGIL